MKQVIQWTLLVCCVFAAGPVLGAVEGSKPNIIFIFGDDWGYGDIGKHGSTFCQTPHLDSMAEEGIDFANFTVNLPEGYQPDGENVLSAFKGNPITRTKPIFWEWRGPDNQAFTWPALGARDGRWKLLVNKERGQVELYDLEKDWPETKNLVSVYPEVVKELSDKLDAWKAQLPTEPLTHCCSAARATKQ
ncbi:hypothetical protein ACFL6U_02035 [Planctomycetota bacterium]